MKNYNKANIFFHIWFHGNNKRTAEAKHVKYDIKIDHKHA